MVSQVEKNQTSGLEDLWGYEANIFVCEECDWSFVIPQNVSPQRCPHCFQRNLSPNDSIAEDKLNYLKPPELILPFALSDTQLSKSVSEFTSGIPFPPPDLNFQNLASRMKRIFLPYWLVDTDVNGKWEVEAGYDYQVVSHQEQYDDNRSSWRTNEIKENRIRWEQRLGRLARSYHNVPAPALEEERELTGIIGQYDMESAAQFSTEGINQTFVRLPNSSPSDAWPQAIPTIQSQVAEDCRRAAQANHYRNFRWSPDFQNLNWTLLLRPIYSTYFFDDNRQPQPILIHGQNGRTSGLRYSSMKRAQRVSAWIFGAAILACLLSILLLGLGFIFPILVVGGVIGFIIAVIAGISALIPIGIAWNFNRKQKS